MRVHVINGKDGRPIPKKAVSVQFFYEKPAKVSPSFHLENDSNGEPRFNIPEPTPAHLFVHGALTYEYWHCTCVFMGPTEAVVHKGVVEAPPKAPIALANPEPGHIIKNQLGAQPIDRLADEPMSRFGVRLHSELSRSLCIFGQ